jgi:hypothetical protein
MTRTIALAFASILAFAGISQAQYYRTTGPVNYQRLENITSPSVSGNMGNLDADRYLRTYRSPNGGLSNPNRNSLSPDEYRPLAYINRLYVSAYGREPSDTEAIYWLRRLDNTSREGVAAELRVRGPQWPGHYDPRDGRDYDSGPAERYLPDPASLSFRDPSGPYFKSPYYSNYEYRRPIRAFSYGTLP